MTKNGHVCAIYCRLEVGDDAISGGNMKIIEGYVVVNFLKLLALTVFKIFKTKSFCDGGGH